MLLTLHSWVIPGFALWGSTVTWLEVLAFALSILMVMANMRVHVVAWPLAIASSLLYGTLFLDSRMYGEAALQVFFILMACWGWSQWRHGTTSDGSALTPRALPPHARWRLAALVVCAWPVLAVGLAMRTDTDVPWLDALPTAGSVAGQWLLARQYIENWPVWIAVNLVSIGLFAVKGLWLTVLLYGIFTVLALLGWRAWQMGSVGAANRADLDTPKA